MSIYGTFLRRSTGLGAALKKAGTLNDFFRKRQETVAPKYRISRGDRLFFRTCPAGPAFFRGAGIFFVRGGRRSPAGVFLPRFSATRSAFPGIFGGLRLLALCFTSRFRGCPGALANRFADGVRRCAGAHDSPKEVFSVRPARAGMSVCGITLPAKGRKG